MDLKDVLSLHLKVHYYTGLLAFKVKDGGKIVTSSAMNFSFVFNIIVFVIFALVSKLLDIIIEATTAVETSEYSSETKVITVSRGIIFFFSMITYLVILAYVVLEKAQHIELLEKLFSVDIELMNNFNINMNYPRQKQILDRVLLFLCFHIYVGTCLFSGYLTLKNFNIPATDRITRYAILGTTTFYSYHFWLLCKLITSRFKIIQQICNERELKKGQFGHLLTINKTLRECVDHLNGAHGVPQFFDLVNDDIFLTLQVYISCYIILAMNMDLTHINNIMAFFFSIPFLVKLILKSTAGDNLKNQIIETNRAISLSYDKRFKGIEAEISSGCPMDKLYGSELKVTAADFFDIDYEMLNLMFSTSITYLVILLQFQDEE